jgi:hypothetical protein
VINVVVVIVIIIAIVDYVRFENTCDNIESVINKLGGDAPSIGGWPFGREFQPRFDHPLSDDSIRRIAIADPESHRIHMIVRFSCEISDSRLEEMRKMVFPHHITIIVCSPKNKKE